MILRNRLQERRAALGVNQQEMGRLCGVSRQTVILIERGGLLSLCHSGPDHCRGLRRLRRGCFLSGGGKA